MKEFWHSAPLVRFTIPLILGMIAGVVLHDYNFNPRFAFIILFVLWCFAVGAWRLWKRSRYIQHFGILVNALFFLAGISLIGQKLVRLDESLVIPEGEMEKIGLVTDYPKETAKSVQLALDVLWDGHDGRSSKIMFYGPQNQGLDTLQPGDYLSFSHVINPFEPPSNPGQFDYAAFMNRKGFAGSVYAKTDVKVYRAEHKRFSFITFLKGLQKKGIQRFRDTGMPSRELGVAAALVLGDRNVLLPEVRQSFASAGVVHILAVSGLHVGIIYLVLLFVIRRILPGEKLRWVRFGLIIAFLWLYAGITGLSPSVLRAATMFSFIALGAEKGKRTNTYNMLAASALVLLILNPLIITEVGFQLSYLAVLGIVTFYRPIYQLLVIQNFLLDKIWSLSVVSFSAQLATFPLTLYYFDQFPNLFLISNLVIIPLATLSLYVGLAYLILFWIPVVGEVLSFVLEVCLFSMNEFVIFFDKIPMAKSTGIHVGLFAMILIYGLFLFIPVSVRFPKRVKPWIPLLALLIVISLRAFSEIRSARTGELWIMRKNNEPVLIAKHGKKALAIVRPEVEVSSHDFFISGYLTQARLKSIESIQLNDSLTNETAICEVLGKTVVYLGKSMPREILESKKPVLVFTEHTDPNLLNEITNGFEALIISPSVYGFRKKAITDRLDHLNLDYHDIRQDGAIKLYAGATPL
jgi:competence protein ComEC